MNLKELSDNATPGPWAWDQRGEKVNEWALGTAFNSAEKPYIGQFKDSDAVYDEYVCSHEAATCNYKNPEFICALVNAYRAGELVERRTEERAAVSPLDKVLVDARCELLRWKMGAPPDQARLQLLVDRITEQSPYRGGGGPEARQYDEPKLDSERSTTAELKRSKLE